MCPAKGRRTYQPKRCGNNNKDEDNSPKTLNDKSETSVLEFWGVCNASLLPLLTDTLKLRVVALVRVLSKGQIKLLNHFQRIIISYLKPYNYVQIICIL